MGVRRPIEGLTLRPNRRTLLLGAGSMLALGGCAVGGMDGPAATTALSPGDNSADQPARPPQATVKVAMLLPLSGHGQSAAIAKGMKQAGELALFDRDDGSFQLVVLDDKGTPDGARAAADQAIKDGAELLLGPLFAANVTAAAGPARAARVPLIAFSNDRQVAGSGAYVIGHLVETEVDRVVSYAIAQGRRRIAALIPDEPYGHLAEAALKAAAQRDGGTIVALQRFPRAANGMLDPARQLGLALRELETGGQPAQALFVPGDPELLAQLAPLMTYAGIETSGLKILGTGAMDQPGLGREKRYIGAWFAAPDPKGWREMNTQFANTFGTAPPRIAALAYDAVGLAVTLSKGAPGNRFSPENLTRTSGFNGVDGLLRLSPQGLPTRSLAVLEVQDFGATVVDTASAPLTSAVTDGASVRLN